MLGQADVTKGGHPAHSTSKRLPGCRKLCGGAGRSRSWRRTPGCGSSWNASKPATRRRGPRVLTRIGVELAVRSRAADGPRVDSETRHRVAVACSLSWADDAAARGDYTTCSRGCERSRPSAISSPRDHAKRQTWLERTGGNSTSPACARPHGVIDGPSAVPARSIPTAHANQVAGTAGPVCQSDIAPPPPGRPEAFQRPRASAPPTITAQGRR